MNFRYLAALMAFTMLTGCGGTRNENSSVAISLKNESVPAQVSVEVATTVKVEWTQDFEAAKARAAQEGKKILADFTGSDWCHWCMKLDEEVFSQPEFKEYAGQALVLFMADFPGKKQIPAETAAQNKKLSEKYGVQGYPTVLLLDAQGTVLATTGYREGGPAAYIEHLKGLLK